MSAFLVTKPLDLYSGHWSINTIHNVFPFQCLFKKLLFHTYMFSTYLGCLWPLGCKRVDEQYRSSQLLGVVVRSAVCNSWGRDRGTQRLSRRRHSGTRGAHTQPVLEESVPAGPGHLLAVHWVAREKPLPWPGHPLDIRTVHRRSRPFRCPQSRETLLRRHLVTTACRQASFWRHPFWRCSLGPWRANGTGPPASRCQRGQRSECTPPPSRVDASSIGGSRGGLVVDTTEGTRRPCTQSQGPSLHERPGWHDGRGPGHGTSQRSTLQTDQGYTSFL